MTPRVKQIFWKSVLSSVAGLPISLTLNAVLMDWIGQIATSHMALTAAVLLAIPFTMASIVRIFTIDWFDIKYNIKLDPVYNINRLIHILRSHKKSIV